MAERIRPLPILSHMPQHVTKKIAEFLDASTQFSLRRCSKDLRKVVDCSATHYGYVEVIFRRTQVDIWVSEPRAKIIIRAHPKGYKIRTTHSEERIVRGKGNYIERTVRFLKSIFKNSKKSCEGLEFCFARNLYSDRKYETIKSEFLEKMGQLLARKQYLLSTEILWLRMDLNIQDVLTFLQFCKPGKLCEFKIDQNARDEEEVETSLFEVTESEQWRQAKKFSGFGLKLALPYYKWAHLELEFVNVPTLSLQELMSLIQSFQLKSDWEFLSVKITEENSEFTSYFASLPVLRPSPGFRWIAIPGTDSSVIKVLITTDYIRLEKVEKRQ